MENVLLSKLKEKENSLLQQLEVIRDMIADELRKSGSNTSVKNVSAENISHSVKTTLGNTVSERFLNVLKQEKRFMKIREIANVIVSIEGGEEDDWAIRLSRKTRELKSKNKIQKFQVGKSRQNVFWGSVNWLNDDGSIKKEYEYDTNALSESGASSIDNIEI